MFNDISKPPPPLPQPRPQELGPGLTLLPPLTRSGQLGPGLLILTRPSDSSLDIREGVPSCLIKWAEEGYAVVEIQTSALTGDATPDDVLEKAIASITACPEYLPKAPVGLVAYDPEGWLLAAPALARRQAPGIAGAVVYADQADRASVATVEGLPLLLQLAGPQGPSATAAATPAAAKTYSYPRALSYRFATPFDSAFHYNLESVSHTRNLTFLKPLLGGPFFDLETLWDEHTYYEFADRSVEHTMSTMVQEPYVNHLPTLTGGIGRANLSDFYRHHFIFSNADDALLDLVSRTTGIDRIVDEFVFCFTHTKPLDWLLPGVPPTGRYIQVPMTAVVNLRGDRLYHEHINWDQACVLRQIDLLPDHLPFPYPMADDSGPAPGKNFEYRLPVLGVECADKLRDRSVGVSNEMFAYTVRQV